MSDPGPLDESYPQDGTPKKKKERPTQITVKFYTPDSKLFTQSYPFMYAVNQVKAEFVDIFGIPYHNIFLLYNEEVLPEEQKLGKLPVDQFGLIELKLLSNDVDHPIRVENVYKDLTVPDILTVKVETEDEGEKEVVVEIDNFAIEKPNLGGYRHIQTGVKYLHAYSQTGPPPSKVPHWLKNSRDTQTFFYRNRRTECHYSRATQMSRHDLCVANVSDRIFQAGPYETAAQREKRLDVVGKVRTIQR